MDTQWISDKISSDFVCFPVDDLNLETSQFCLKSFYEFLEETTDLNYNDIATVCQCIRFWIAKNRSFYVDKDSNILIRLNLKDFKGDL